MVALIEHLDSSRGEGAVLVFMPGMFEISSLCAALTWSVKDGDDHSTPDWVSPVMERSFHRLPLTAALQAEFDERHGSPDAVLYRTAKTDR